MVTLPESTVAEILEQAPDGIVLVDSAGSILIANRRVAELFGIPQAELIGAAVESLLPEPLRELHVAHRSGYQSKPRIRPMGDSRLGLRGRRADGHELPIDIHLAPLSIGDHRWSLAFIRDASERQHFLEELRCAKRQAEEIARMKGEFLALAAHDLTQPQQTLELLINAVGESASPGSQTAEFAARASALLARMRELLKMLLEISALESGTMRIREEPVRVAELFGDLERQFIIDARAKSLRFGIDPCSHIVETDPQLLRGLLSNLIGNAIRYTHQGEVSLRCVEPQDGGLRLMVGDTGIGIPGDQLHRIFEDFERLEEGRHAHRDGFGLGLGIVRRLSALLGLPISVNSVVGRGSIFAVEVPPAKVHAA